MFDFITNDLCEELKTNEIYNLFKTESLEFNIQFLSNLENYPNALELIEHYLKIDTQNFLNQVDNISLTTSKIMNEENNDSYIPEYELYTCGVSKIISLLCLIQKINQLQNDLIKNTKNYIKNFYKANKKQCLLKEKIDIFINDLISVQSNQRRSISRRSTNDITNTSIHIHSEKRNSLLKNHLNEKDANLKNKNDYLTIRRLTPKFEETLNTEQKNNKEEITIRDSVKVDSSLTLQKMNFVEVEEKHENFNRNSGMNKNHKIKNNSCESCPRKRKKNKSRSTKIKSTNFFKNRNNSVNSCDDTNTQNERRKILAELLDSINILYKSGKITSNKKINIKQIIISNPKIIVDKFYQYYTNVNKEDKNFQIFLLKEFKDLK